MFPSPQNAIEVVTGGYLRRQPAGREKTTALMVRQSSTWLSILTDQVTQGMLAVVPGMLLIGWASSSKILYGGLLLYSFGKSHSISVMLCLMGNSVSCYVTRLWDSCAQSHIHCLKVWSVSLCSLQQKWNSCCYRRGFWERKSVGYSEIHWCPGPSIWTICSLCR